MEYQSEQQELKDIIASREDGFGFIFKQARNEKKLGIDDIARELRLDKKIILALENEDYTQLPVPAFVYGYIRNYAKFLNVQSEPLIEYYKKECVDENFEPKLKISKEMRTQSSSIISALLGPLLLLLILAGLVAGGWQLWPYISKNYLTDDQQHKSILPDAVNDDSDTLLLPEIDGSYDLPADEEVIEQDSKIVEDQTGTGVSSPVDNVLQKKSSIQSENSSVPEGSLLAEGSIATDDILPAEVAATANNVSVDIPAIPEDSSASDFKTNQLVVEFSGNSWVSIKDIDNRILSSGLIKSGKTLRLDGKLPYKVFLGDARMVVVSINGNVFDHSAYINEKNIARFQVK